MGKCCPSWRCRRRSPVCRVCPPHAPRPSRSLAALLPAILPPRWASLGTADGPPGMPGIHRPVPASSLGRVFGVPLHQALPVFWSWWPAPRWRRGVPGVPRRSRAPHRGPRCSDKAERGGRWGASGLGVRGRRWVGAPRWGLGKGRLVLPLPNHPSHSCLLPPARCMDTLRTAGELGWAGARARCQAKNRLVLEQCGPGMPVHCGRVVSQRLGGSAVPPAPRGWWAGWVAAVCAGRWEPLGR